MAGRSLIIRVGLAFWSLVGLLAVGEVGLRLLQRPFAPAEFQARNDARLAGAGKLGRAPVSFDPALFWRREGGPPIRREPSEFLLLVLGDEGALGQPDTRAAWPETLAYLVGLNETARAVRVVNAAEPGYSSFQGVRRFAQLAGLRPDAVCFAFGRSDARQVRMPDAEYGRRLDSMGPLSTSWLALRVAHAGWEVP